MSDLSEEQLHEAVRSLRQAGEPLGAIWLPMPDWSRELFATADTPLAMADLIEREFQRRYATRAGRMKFWRRRRAAYTQQRSVRVAP